MLLSSGQQYRLIVNSKALLTDKGIFSTWCLNGFCLIGPFQVPIQSVILMRSVLRVPFRLKTSELGQALMAGLPAWLEDFWKASFFSPSYCRVLGALRWSWEDRGRGHGCCCSLLFTTELYIINIKGQLGYSTGATTSLTENFCGGMLGPRWGQNGPKKVDIVATHFSCCNNFHRI